MNKITHVEFQTVGDLRRFLMGADEIADNIPLESFGPDSGGYDVCSGNNVVASFDGKRLFIASGDEHEIPVWDTDKHNKIVGRVKGHPVFLDDLGSNPTVTTVQTHIANGLKVSLRMYPADVTE